jgi:hypothetical protein
LSFSFWEKVITSGTAKRPLNLLIKSPSHQTRTILLIVGVAAITLSLSIIIPALLDVTTRLNFPSIGTIRTIGVKAYNNANMQNETTQIQWGKVYTGSSTNVTLYLKSTSNIKTVLYLQTANWTLFNSTEATISGPNSTTPYLNLTWNYNNTAINPGQTIPVTLTLSVANSLTFTQFLVTKEVRYFSFDIIITAEEQTT